MSQNVLMRVERFVFAKDWTLSRFFIMNELKGYGVEDEMRNVKVKGETAIPFGIYPLGYRQSPKFSKEFYYDEAANKLIGKKDYYALPAAQRATYRPHDLLWVKDVPGFEYVLIHWGNTDDDTDGCYIVGNNIAVVNGQDGVVLSRSCYLAIYPLLYKKVKEGGQAIEYVRAA